MLFSNIPFDILFEIPTPFDTPLIKFAFTLLKEIIKIADLLLISITKFAIGSASGINLLRSYMHKGILEFLLTSMFSALGMTKNSLGGFYFFAIILAILMYGLFKIYTIFAPQSRPWINVENLIRNTLMAVVLVTTGFTFLTQIEQLRIEMSESIALSLFESVSTSGLPEANHNLDYPAICYQGLGTPCDPQLDCNNGVGCINKSVADRTGGLVGIKTPEEIYKVELPPDFAAEYNLNDMAYPLDFGSLAKMAQQWSSSITLAAISSVFSVPILLESLSLLMIDVTALILFMVLPLAIAFSFFNITESFFSQLIQKYINVIVMSFVLFTVIPMFIEMSFKVGGYITLGMTATLLWGAAIFIVYRPLMDSMLFAVDGAFQSAGIGGFSQAMKDFGGLATGALTFGIGVATGGATLGLSALGGLSGVKNNETLNSAVGTAKSVSGMLSGAALSQSQFGRGIVSAASMLGSDKNQIGIGAALRHASVSDSMATGMAAVQNKGIFGLLYASDRLKRGAESNMLDKVSSGDPVAVQDNEALEYKRLRKSAARGSVDAQNKINRMMGEKINDSGDIDIASDKYLAPVGRGVAEIKTKASSNAQQEVVANKLSDTMDVANDGKVKFINSSKVVSEVGKMGTATAEDQRKIGDNVTSVMGASGSRAAMSLARQPVGRDANGKTVTALDTVQDAYQDALGQLSSLAPDGNILPLLRDSNGSLSENAPLMKAFNQALSDRGGEKIMTNGALRANTMEYLNSATKVQAQLPGVAMVSSIRNAVDKGVSPVANLQATYGISPDEVSGGFGAIVSHLAQNPEGDMAPVINAIASSPRQEALQSFTEKLQAHLRTETAKGDDGDKNVQSLVNKSKTGFRHVQASRAVVTDMVKNKMVDREEWEAFRETYREAASSMGMEADNETMLWRTVEALRTIPANVSVMVNPSSPLAMESGGYVPSSNSGSPIPAAVVTPSVSNVANQMGASNIPLPSTGSGFGSGQQRASWEQSQNVQQQQDAALMQSLISDFEVLNEEVQRKQADYVVAFGANAPEVSISVDLSSPTVREIEQVNAAYRQYISNLDAMIMAAKSVSKPNRVLPDEPDDGDLLFFDENG